jgi:hypothetical protein
MAPGVYQTFITEVVCSTLTSRDEMIRFYGFSRYRRDSTQSASVSLSLVQYQPLFRGGFPSRPFLLALHPVLAQCWVIGRVFPCDFCEAGDGGCVGLNPFRLAFIKCPMAVIPEVAGFHPFTSLGRVSAFRPPPEHMPVGMSDFLEDVLGSTVPVIIRPASYDGIEFFDYPPCRGLLMGVRVGTYGPHVFEDFVLLWDAQQFPLGPEFPDVKPQEVKPFFDVHDPGFGFTECQPSLLEELFHPWSGIGFQYVPHWGRYHKVIGVAHDGYAFVQAFAEGWAVGPAVSIFGVEQPFHPIPGHICQQGEMTPPCGVPVSVGEKEPIATTPALSHWRNVVVNTGGVASNGPWSILSKQPLISASSIHGLQSCRLVVIWMASIASIVQRPGRNP